MELLHDGHVLGEHGRRLWLYPPDQPGGIWVEEDTPNEPDLVENGWRPVTKDDLPGCYVCGGTGGTGLVCPRCLGKGVILEQP